MTQVVRRATKANSTPGHEQWVFVKADIENEKGGLEKDRSKWSGERYQGGSSCADTFGIGVTARESRSVRAGRQVATY
jgi:hypothetical protein